jgi:CRP-like cAMP-binding protein
MSVALDRKTLLSLSPINTLNPEHLQWLLTKAEAIQVRSGERLFTEGDSTKTHFYVVDGEIELKGENHPPHRVKAGSTEARKPLAHAFPRPVTATAKTRAKVIKIDSELLDIMLTWDQTGTYSVEEVEEDETEPETDWMTRLLQTKAFHQIPPANIQAMFMRMQAVSYRAGDVVIRQGDEGDFFYIITEGRCEVTRTTPANPDGVSLAELAIGDSFGEEALISNAARNATITMLTDGSMMRLAKSDFIELLNAPLLQWVGYQQACELVAKQGAQWLDARLPSEHEHSRITGSINIPLIFLRMKAASLDAGRRYIAYCDTGRRSSAAAYLLAERGFDILVLEGGLASVPPEALETAG